MKLCAFEDSGVEFLEPLSLTRPAFDLRCGVGTLLERQRRNFGAPETGAWVRSNLVSFARLIHPNLPINDDDWLRRGPTVLVNARWLAPTEVISDLETPRVGICGSQVAYVVAPSFEWADMGDGVEVVLSKCQALLP